MHQTPRTRPTHRTRQRSPVSEEISLREYVESKFAAQEKAVSAALAAQKEAVAAALASSDKAVEKSEKQADNWRASANEWRGAMQDREVKFVQRETYDALLERVTKIEKQQIGAARETTGERRGISSSWSLLIQVVTIALAATMVYLGLK